MKGLQRNARTLPGAELTSLGDQAAPTQVEMEFSMGFSAKANAWILTAKGDHALKVKMIWNPTTNAKIAKSNK